MRATHRTINKNDPKAHFNFCDLPNCIFLTERGACSKLNVHSCAGASCAFIKTAGEASRNDSDWQKRLSSLDADKQLAIAKKYYGGKMPWNTSAATAK